MRRAYSLIRFSSWKQAHGESYRRQAEWSAAVCGRNGWHLDVSLRTDKPVSAFRGKNRTKGALADFLEMTQVGRVAKGSILLIESLDRLSREETDEALMLFLGILKAGVEIVTKTPERQYTKGSVGDIVGLLEPILIMSRAHEESLTKSGRIAAQWDQRRKEAAQTPMNSNGPAWLRLVDGVWEVIGGRAETVRRIFALCVEGLGLHAICARLNDPQTGSPPISNGKRRGKHWGYSYVGLILRNRAVLGELQPHVFEDGKRKPVGKPLADYYPRVVEDSLFYRAQAALDGRKNQRGRKGKFVRNLFTGLLRDARDGCTMVTVSESDKCKTVKLVSSGGQRGKKGSDYRTFPYEVLERGFLTLLREVTPADVVGRNGTADEVAGLTAKLQTLARNVEKVQANLRAYGDFDTGLSLLRDLEREKGETSKALEAAKAKASHPAAEVLGEAQSLADLLDAAEEGELLPLRTKIKARIADLVEDMRFLVVPRGRDRVAALQVFFRESGLCRDYLMWFSPGRSYGESRVEPVCKVGSLAEAVGKGDLDLRDRSHALALEAELLALDLEALP
jgi:DNA invertase Pin-like site-specific DNA recombinase